MLIHKSVTLFDKVCSEAIVQNFDSLIINYSIPFSSKMEIFHKMSVNNDAMLLSIYMIIYMDNLSTWMIQFFYHVSQRKKCRVLEFYTMFYSKATHNWEKYPTATQAL